MKTYEIVRVSQENYPMFDDMVFWRINGRERTQEEKLDTSKLDFSSTYSSLSNSNLYVYAVQDEQKFVGWISIVYLPKVGKLNNHGHLYVDELWIEPSYRKQGIAEQLMKKADELAVEINVSGIRLYVSIENKSAKRLYIKCGYS